MTSTLLAEFAPGSTPDALSGAEGKLNTPGLETEPRDCPEVLDDPVRPLCDDKFPVHQFRTR